MPDHPRSRGVYSTMISILFIRGDHPRSRGVYHAKVRTRVIEEGSSPLARGLQFATNTDVTQRRIIPARAGFTCPKGRRTSTGPDHPRSRGVYGRRHDPAVAAGGSSPLARGLRRVVGHEAHHRRIIPARAGFTRPARTGTHTSSDHPRSRGVYAESAFCRACSAGSSPLARGLRAQTLWNGIQTGIIPARAGFTW